MNQSAIVALLKQKIGLDASTLSSSTIAREINRRMAACGLTDMQAYLVRLQTSPQELEELIEQVVVPETWFFRYPESFAFLSSYVMSEWYPTHRAQVLRVLSVPCSTGEEPYSIAIALIEAGLAAKNFCIDAVDISKQSLKKAQQALYGRNSFRGNNVAFRERYFTQIGEEHQLYDSVKRSVNFIQGNLLDRYFLVDNSYDVIFCRNLLIYFDSTGREQTIRVLDRLLNPQGLLFVGPSETLLPPQFVSVRYRSAFAYRKVEAKNQLTLDGKNSVTKREPTEIKKPLQKSNYRLETTSNQFLEQPKEVKNIPLSQNTQPPTSMLETAQNLADQGKLDEALTTCVAYLSQNPTSVQAYFLWGQLCEITGNQEQALICFQKALYLEPNHYEALIHLALLKEQSGDIANAIVIRQRIQRLQKFQS